MKKIFLMILMTFISCDLFYSQTIFSNGTGGGSWSSETTWQGGQIPDATSSVVIAGTDSVYNEGEVTCENLTVLSGGKLATSTESIIVTSTFELEADAYFYNNASSPTVPGADIILDPASYVVHSGSGTIGGPNNFEFGNLVISRGEGVTAAADLIINGNLIVDMIGNQTFRGARATLGESHTHTVFGDVYIYEGILSCIDGDGASMYCIWNIEGNVYVYGSATSRISGFTSANGNGLGIFNIKGDLIVDGGRFQAGNSSTVGLGTAIFNLGGNFSLSSNSSFSSTTHAGPLAINFVGEGTQTVTLGRNMAFAYPLYDTVSANSTVILDLADSNWSTTVSLGDFVVNGSLELAGNSKISGGGNFTLNPGATLKIGSATGISATEEMGNILVTGTRTFSSEANYEYKGTESQVPGSGLPSTVNGLAVNNGEQLVLFGDLMVNNSLNIISGDLDLNSNTVTLGENAVLTETAGNTVIGSGKLTITKNISGPAELNVGGLGAMITTASDLGSTTIERTHSAASGNGNQGILRQYNIMPGQNNSGLNATLRLYYDESELNGLAEEGLILFKSPSGEADSWTGMGGSVNADENYVELTEVTDFSFWTIANINQTLPVDENQGIPVKFAVHQNYPNPFNPATKIKFEVPVSSIVNITVYNVLGEKVKTLVNDFMEAGFHHINFEASDLPSGTYIYRMTAGDFTAVNKMLLLK